MQTSSLGVIAASSLSINCQNNLNSERQGSYMGDFADKPNDNIRAAFIGINRGCLLYTSPSPRDRTRSRMPSSA